MYLSDRDLRWAIECGNLIVDPPPKKIDPTSIDLHLDSVEQAKVWDVDAFNSEIEIAGLAKGELRIGKFDYKKFAPKYLRPPSADCWHTRRRGESNRLCGWQEYPGTNGTFGSFDRADHPRYVVWSGHPGNR